MKGDQKLHLTLESLWEPLLYQLKEMLRNWETATAVAAGCCDPTTDKRTEVAGDTVWPFRSWWSSSKLRSTKDFMIHQGCFDPAPRETEDQEWQKYGGDHASFLHGLRISTNKTYFKCICICFVGQTGEQRKLQGSTDHYVVGSHLCCLSPTRTPWDLLSPRTLEMFSRHEHPGCWQDT